MDSNLSLTPTTLKAELCRTGSMAVPRSTIALIARLLTRNKGSGKEESSSKVCRTFR